ncbi:site-specific DNA-methyltransferase [Intestinibacillus massiliensis]|uniref:site-specific DNA-methyltransferase n=1 Tax=Intestinibacillus massiliensis TaxID=1871029 RepID=UPI000B34B59F|nr:site-specific DNA-methyltransferase [Intestinibacillus massiliensis]
MANKLELTWYGKDEPIKVEPRLLIEAPALSNCTLAPDTDNMLIHGDNLLALKALEKKFAGQVKCVYIDPPYNTGSAFEHYDDNLEHSQWLNLMRPRLEILWNLLREEGSIWISIDDDEQAYMKVLCDELFGREHFVSSMVWQKRTSPDMRAVISDGHEYILLYVKDREKFKKVRNRLPLSAEQASTYKNPDHDPRGDWTSADYTAQGYRPNQMYEITTPGGTTFTPPDGKCWKNIEAVFLQQVAENRIWFGPDGCAMPRRKTFLSEHEGVIPWTWWTNKEVGHNQEAKKEIISLFSAANVFDTPKPERLIERIIYIATNPGDLVLDSFLGSGTTAAVAHKMGRRYIGIEMGEHAYTHCKVRLDKVIAGEDQGGITKSQNWQGGGGYRFYELAPTLINMDAFGEAIINPDYDADALAAAVALHEGFTYQPSADLFWKQAVGNENSFLFTTTRHLTSAYLESIKGSMEEGEYLVIACRSYDKGLDRAYETIAVKKIPQMLLDRCEFGRDDYSLNIVHPPVYEDEEVAHDE